MNKYKECSEIGICCLFDAFLFLFTAAWYVLISPLTLIGWIVSKFPNGYTDETLERNS